jgi:hypothetical protein
MQAIRFRPYLLLLWVAIILLIESCQEAIETPQPVLPIPTNPCAPSFNSGYTEKISYAAGEKMKAYIHSSSNTDPCRLDVYDLSGNVAFSVRANLKIQNSTNAEPAINGFGYSFASEFEIPVGTKSGIYQIEKKIPFIVKTLQPVDITIVYPSNTDNAYALAGGRSLYSNRASIVSFHRPMELQWQAITGLKWFITLSNLSVNYIADNDLDDYTSVQNSKIIVLVGHSEYWTRKARKNFDRFVEEGKHAIILSGNTMWWQVRYSLQHQMICYKSNYANSEKDPIADPLFNTIEWDHPTLQYSILSSIGADFPRGGYGLQPDNGWDGYKIVAPQSPLLEGLGLKKGDILSLPSGEYDGAPISKFTPDGFPEIDNTILNFHRIELIGFDKGARGGKETIGTFIVFQKTPTSGIIVNGASYDWCSHRGLGGRDGDKLKTITLNAISKLLNQQNVFSN